MTRIQNKGRRAGMTLVMALMVAMALGLAGMVVENEAHALVDEFGMVLESVDSDIMSVPGNEDKSGDASDTMRSGDILAHFAHVSAFDEVIQRQQQ